MVTYTPPNILSPTLIDVNVSATKGMLVGSTTTQITVHPPDSLTLFVDIVGDPVRSLRSNEATSIMVRVTATGNPVSDASVLGMSFGEGTFEPASWRVLGNGYYTSEFSIPRSSSVFFQGQASYLYI